MKVGMTLRLCPPHKTMPLNACKKLPTYSKSKVIVNDLKAYKRNCLILKISQDS